MMPSDIGFAGVIFVSVEGSVTVKLWIFHSIVSMKEDPSAWIGL
jgi:hypothetical protein